MKKKAVKTKKQKPSFKVPEGFYRAEFADAVVVFDDPRVRDTGEKIRLLFDLPQLTKGTKTFRAGKDYERDLTDESPLNQVANVLLDRKLTAKDLEGPHCGFQEAIGQEVDLRIVHFQGKGYKAPYSRIESIVPVGTWEEEGDDEPEVVDKPGNVQIDPPEEEDPD